MAWPTSDDNSCQYARGLIWGIWKFLFIVARWQSGSDHCCPELFDIQLCPHIDRHSWMAWGHGMLAGLSSHIELLAHSSYISYVGKTNILTSKDVLGLFDIIYLFFYKSAMFTTIIYNMDAYASYTFYMVVKRSAKEFCCLAWYWLTSAKFTMDLISLSVALLSRDQIMTITHFIMLNLFYDISSCPSYLDIFNYLSDILTYVIIFI